MGNISLNILMFRVASRQQASDHVTMYNVIVIEDPKPIRTNMYAVVIYYTVEYNYDDVIGHLCVHEMGLDVLTTQCSVVFASLNKFYINSMFSLF